MASGGHFDVACCDAVEVIDTDNSNKRIVQRQKESEVLGWFAQEGRVYRQTGSGYRPYQGRGTWAPRGGQGPRERGRGGPSRSNPFKQPQQQQQKQAPQQRAVANENTLCWGCNSYGHLRRDCPGSPWVNQDVRSPPRGGQGPRGRGRGGPSRFNSCQQQQPQQQPQQQQAPKQRAVTIEDTRCWGCYRYGHLRRDCLDNPWRNQVVTPSQ